MNKILLEVIGLTFSHSQSGAYTMILGEKDSNLRLPIVIGDAEAQSIAVAIEGYQNKRPFTHDLLMNFASTFNVSIIEVVVCKFKEGIFYSEIHCTKDGETYILDARTSDAVATAVRCKCPIYTYPQIMEEAAIRIDDSELDNDADDDLDIEQGYEDLGVDELETLLKDSVEREDYAMASKLRDIINEKKN